MRNCAQILGLYLALNATAGHASTVSAQANLRNVLPGGRASMMGGAYTAISDDPSGAYYNPGGLGFLTDQSFDVSATAYRKQSIIYKDAIKKEPIEQQSVNIFPSFLGLASKLGRFTLGYSFVSLDQRSIYQQNKYENITTAPYGSATFEQTHQEENTHVLAGASAAIRLGAHWAAGLSLYYYQRNINATTIQLSTYNGGRLWSTTHTYQTLNTGISPIFGVKARYGIVDFGLSVMMPRSITDRTNIITTQIIYDPTFENNTAPTTERDDYKLVQLNEVNPTTYRGGIAVHPVAWFTGSADLLVHEGKKNHHVDGTAHDFLTTYDFSVGMELGGPTGGLRAGYFSNNSLFRELSENNVNQPAHINYTGYAIGFGWRVKGFQGELAMVQQRGRGKAQSITDSETIQDVSALNTLYSISGNLPVE